MICGFPHSSSLDFLVEGPGASEAVVMLLLGAEGRDGKVPQSGQRRPLFPYCLAGFWHKRALAGKEQYRGMWPILIIVLQIL